jgi:hypothetical protein
MATSTASLGTLAVLPREIRDRIYTYTLDQGPFCPKEGPRRPRNPTALVRASRAIHAEAIIVLYLVNEFAIIIEYDHDIPDNRSIMSTRGYTMSVKHYSSFFTKYTPPVPPARHMLRYMRQVVLDIGGILAINEFDIVPAQFQTLSGPQRPAFRSLLDVVEETCALLNGCVRLLSMNVTLMSNDDVPGSVDLVLAHLLRLRGIPNSNFLVGTHPYTGCRGWSLKPGYLKHLSSAVALPAGAATPKFTVTKEKFERVNPLYQGEYSDEEGDEYDDEYTDDGIYEDMAYQWHEEQDEPALDSEYWNPSHYSNPFVDDDDDWAGDGVRIKMPDVHDAGYFPSFGAAGAGVGIGGLPTSWWGMRAFGPSGTELRGVGIGFDEFGYPINGD